jgi:hypothetical protein
MCDNYGMKAKPLKFTTHNRMQSLSKYTKFSIICSYRLTWKIIMKILKEEGNIIDFWLLPSIHFMVSKLSEALITQHCRKHKVLINLCLADIWFKILTSEETGIGYKKENRLLSISSINEKTRVELVMNIRLDTKFCKKHLEFSGNCQNLVKFHIRNEFVQEWYNQKIKGNCIRKGECQFVISGLKQWYAVQFF